MAPPRKITQVQDVAEIVVPSGTVIGANMRMADHGPAKGSKPVSAGRKITQTMDLAEIIDPHTEALTTHASDGGRMNVNDDKFVPPPEEDFSRC
jgi:hypothetical protein